MDSEFALEEYFVDKRLISVTHWKTDTQHTIHTQLWSKWMGWRLEESEKLTHLFFKKIVSECVQMNIYILKNLRPYCLLAGFPLMAWGNAAQITLHFLLYPVPFLLIFWYSMLRFYNKKLIKILNSSDLQWS